MAIQIRTSLAEPDTGETFTPHRPARPDKAEGGRKFVLRSDYTPAGDQPSAIKELTEAALEGEKSQVLLGVTGSGKTYTMPHIARQDVYRPVRAAVTIGRLTNRDRYGIGFFPAGAARAPHPQAAISLAGLANVEFR